MSEPASAAVSGWMGMKFLTLIGSFAGGVISLSFVQNLNRWQGLIAVVTGLTVGAFLSPIFAPWTADMLHGLAAGSTAASDWENKVEAAYGFLFGITGMTLVPGFIHLAEKFREDPLWVIRFVLNKGKGDQP